MHKNSKQSQARRDLVTLAMESPKCAAKVIKAKALRLSKAKNSTETARILADLLYISEATVYRDFAE